MRAVGIFPAGGLRETADGLRNELIGRTVRDAAGRSPFYRRHFADLDLSIIHRIEDLAVLPRLAKSDVRAAGYSILCGGQIPSHVQNTSGSTGSPLLLFRSQEEMTFIRAFFSHVHGEEAGDRLRPVVLALTIPHHGTPTPIPGHAFVLQTALTDDELLDQSITLLESSFDLHGVENRVSAIVGSFSQILVLTNYLLENGRMDLAESIRHIELTGDYLTPRWRKILASVWRCSIVDRYSLAEIFGGATHCPLCGSYHFDPHVIPELVVPGKQEPVEAGVIGELLLTSLSPFVQYQPFIRYVSGDLFVRRAIGCRHESWEFRGRTTHALFDPRDPSRLLIDGRAVIDAIDVLPTVSRPSRYRDLTALSYSRSSGRPVYAGSVEVVGTRVRARLRIELAHTPALFPDATREIVDAVGEAVLSQAPVMRNAVAAGDIHFEVECVPPGVIQPLEKRSQVWEIS
ncbi:MULTISPECIES: phenylacetate--CoA ligase family protein [unclassified Mesorhizobium]|uniref:phenylacetate--CoA ligase family protein n=1 Tax=unclassified Mesorhizobium TaxID=325217 RepID=UPI001091B824|nr:MULTISPECIES: phenylacetate--CoA ligase family protein [unclassified Mesorhizobium]TGP89079.1 phenylacetate--CoA ligase family protein [Mesorhizobium sp. M8A.F.Ca.ET.218.01.1.1]TGT16242.1 phenylacetate--CoA ligase family protein [Mesorhizobium sp. M8A.F.Ca.ET.213.01.1.1]